MSKSEQKDDDATKSYCDKELTKSLQDKKDSEEAIATSEAAIEEMTDESATLGDEIKRLGKEIKALDKAVAEATEQRKEEHGEFITFQTENNAALQLIEKAKNKLSFSEYLNISILFSSPLRSVERKLCG